MSDKELNYLTIINFELWGDFNQALALDTEVWAIRPFPRGHSIEWQQQVY